MPPPESIQLGPHRVIAADPVQAVVEKGMKEALPLNGRIAMGESCVQQRAVLNKQKSFYNNGRNLRVCVIAVSGIAKLKQGAAITVEDFKTCGILLAIHRKSTKI